MESSVLPLEIFDHNILALVFNYVSTHEWEIAHLRLVCKMWNETIIRMLKNDNIYSLIFSGYYLSAVRLMESPRKDRPGNRVRSRKLLNMVCGEGNAGIGTFYHPIHCGLIKYFFYKFRGTSIGDALNILVRNKNSVHKVRAMAIFTENGHHHSTFTLTVAAKYNVIELARALEEKRKPTLYNSYYTICNNPLESLTYAAEHNNEEMAKIIMKYNNFYHPNSKQLIEIAQNLPSVFADLLSKISEYKNALSDLYDEFIKDVNKYKQFIDIIEDSVLIYREEQRIEAERKAKEDAAYKNILDTVKISIKRKLIEKHGDKYNITFMISDWDVRKINWSKPWGFKYNNPDEIYYSWYSTKPGSITVDSLYNL